MSETPGGSEVAPAQPDSGTEAGRPQNGAAALADLEARLAEAQDLRLRALADADSVTIATIRARVMRGMPQSIAEEIGRARGQFCGRHNS